MGFCQIVKHNGFGTLTYNANKDMNRRSPTAAIQWLECNETTLVIRGYPSEYRLNISKINKSWIPSNTSPIHMSVATLVEVVPIFWRLKTAVTPACKLCSYCSLSLSYRYVLATNNEPMSWCKKDITPSTETPDQHATYLIRIHNRHRSSIEI